MAIGNSVGRACHQRTVALTPAPATGSRVFTGLLFVAPPRKMKGAMLTRRRVEGWDDSQACRPGFLAEEVLGDMRWRVYM
jgi:hypothetical protein